MGNIVEVLDESRPAYDLEKLHEQYKGTLIGDYIEQFADSGSRPVVEDKALYHGLQSLLNASVLVNGRVMQDAEQKDLGRYFTDAQDVPQGLSGAGRTPEERESC